MRHRRGKLSVCECGVAVELNSPDARLRAFIDSEREVRKFRPPCKGLQLGRDGGVGKTEIASISAMTVLMRLMRV